MRTPIHANIGAPRYQGPVPDAPTDVIATSGSANFATVEWSYPQGSPQATGWAFEQLLVGTNQGNPQWLPADVWAFPSGASRSAVMIFNVPPTGQVIFRVAGVNGGGRGAFSAQSNVITLGSTGNGGGNRVFGTRVNYMVLANRVNRIAGMRLQYMVDVPRSNRMAGMRVSYMVDVARQNRLVSMRVNYMVALGGSNRVVSMRVNYINTSKPLQV